MANPKSNTTPNTSSTPDDKVTEPKPEPTEAAGRSALVTAAARARPSRAIKLQPLRLPGSSGKFVRILRDVETLSEKMRCHPTAKWHNPNGERFELEVDPVRDTFYMTDVRDGLLVKAGAPNPPNPPANAPQET